MENTKATLLEKECEGIKFDVVRNGDKVKEGLALEKECRERMLENVENYQDNVNEVLIKLKLRIAMNF